MKIFYIYKNNLLILNKFDSAFFFCCRTTSDSEITRMQLIHEAISTRITQREQIKRVRGIYFGQDWLPSGSLQCREA